MLAWSCDKLYHTLLKYGNTADGGLENQGRESVWEGCQDYSLCTQEVVGVMMYYIHGRHIYGMHACNAACT